MVSQARFQIYLSPERCFWRLLGGNNRGYGRSLTDEVSLETARASALAAARAAATGGLDLTSSNGRLWSWALLDDQGNPVARSDGTYGRRVECLAGLQRFRLQAPYAPVVVTRIASRRATTPVRASRPGVAAALSPAPRTSWSSVVSPSDVVC